VQGIRGGTSAEDANMEAPQAPMGWGYGGVSLPHQGGSEEGTAPTPDFFSSILDLKIAGFCAF